MTVQMAMVLAAFLFMIVFMIWGKIEPCIVVMLTLGFLWFTKILDTGTAFGQFSGNTIITMVCMMICSAGLMKTNILHHITKLVKKMNGGERLLYVVAMLVPFILCQFMGGVSSLMATIPLLVGLADTNDVPRTKLILPVLVGSQFGIGLFLIGLIFNNQLGLSPGQISFAGAVLYMLLDILPHREAFGSVNWSIVFMVGFGIAICSALQSSGAVDVIAEFSGKVITSKSSLVLLCIIMFVFCATVTQFMDNNALVNIMTPIMIAACIGVGLKPLAIVCVIDLSSMASIMTPLSGPGGMLAYTMGGYSYKDMIKFGAPIVLVQAVVSAVWVPFYFGLL